MYLQKYPDIAILYKPPSHPGLEKALLSKRRRGGAHLIPATATGLRQLYAHIRSGKGAGVLPDQQPSTGQGRFAPFYGNPALTAVLVPRLVQRTNCIVLAGVCERLPGGRYRVHVLPVDEDIHSDDMVTSLTAMNRAIEECIAIDPAQYLWSYRRFKTQPEGVPGLLRLTHWSEPFIRDSMAVLTGEQSTSPGCRTRSGLPWALDSPLPAGYGPAPG